jgi:hypothetical protein
MEEMVKVNIDKFSGLHIYVRLKKEPENTAVRHCITNIQSMTDCSYVCGSERLQCLLLVTAIQDM